MPEDPDHWKEKGKLAASAVLFDRIIHGAASSLFIELMRTGSDYGCIQFQTPGGRPARMILAIGENACDVLGAVNDSVTEISTEDPDAEDDEDFQYEDDDHEDEDPRPRQHGPQRR